MKTYDASLIKVLTETDHYVKIFHPTMKTITEKEAIYFFEWLRSVGYRYVEGDTFAARYLICEKIAK